ncbi:MAG: Na+/H+ antiporter NhaA, partial [Gemmatimonadaceae bacterium]
MREAFKRIAADARLSSLLLLAATAVALLWANAPFGASYVTLWDTPFTIGPHGHALTLSVHAWINDALMALFFLQVGLEIERELLVGSLRSARAAALPIAAAIGGMLVPAACYLLMAGQTPNAHGWGIPMATDIAFAIGLLGLLAPGLPPAVRAFLVALAIVDDLGAILVIAFAYGAPPDWHALGGAAGCLVVLALLRLSKVHQVTPYVLAAIPLWVFLHEGGIHPSLAGVCLAFAIPTTSRRPNEPTPSERTEHALHSWVTVGILPLFALANAGVVLGDAFSPTAPFPVLSGIVLGLVVGKPVGIVAASWLAIRSGIAERPEGLTWSRILTVGCFGGIGFTMALFVTALAFTTP